jgi:hypothetical protein
MTFFILVPVDPETARSRLGGALHLRPAHFWSLDPLVDTRVLASVAGSNVYLDVRIQPVWWAFLLIVTVATVLAIGRSRRTGDLVAPAICAILLAVIVAALLFKVLYARERAFAAVTSRAAEDVSGWIAIASLSALGIVFVLAAATTFAFRFVEAHRPAPLPSVAPLTGDPVADANFIPGTPRQAVINTLGEPDSVETGDQIDTQHIDPEARCIKWAVTELDFVSRRDETVGCSVYLDGHDRVLCVEHRKF